MWGMGGPLGPEAACPPSLLCGPCAGMEVYPSRTQLPGLLPQPVLAGVLGGLCFLGVAVLVSILVACVANRRRAARRRKRLRQGRAGHRRPPLREALPCWSCALCPAPFPPGGAGRLPLGEGLCLGPGRALGLPVSPVFPLSLQSHLFCSLRRGCQLYCKSPRLPGLLPCAPFLHLGVGGAGSERAGRRGS